jgi:hypothetical protein
VAQIERAEQIEPLPDIDFNIQAGNTLVGFATYEEVQQAITTRPSDGQIKMLSSEDESTMARIEAAAQDVDRLFRVFRQQQTTLGGAVTPEDKHELRRRLDALNDELNHYLAAEYGVEMKKGGAYAQWLATHQPFHWFVEFYGIMQRGGFDVIIGNPPYVEYGKVKDEYMVRNYSTEASGNLYAFTMERSFDLLKLDGSFGMIIPLSTFCTQRMKDVWDYMSGYAAQHWVSHFGWRPSKLFQGVNHRLSIALARLQPDISPKVYTTKYNKWNADARDILLPGLTYVEADGSLTNIGIVPKVGSTVEHSILQKVVRCTRTLGTLTAAKTQSIIYYKNTGVNHWITTTDFPPKAYRGEQLSQSTRQTEFVVQDRQAKDFALCCLNSSLFLWFYIVRTNCRDLNPSDIRTFPIPEGIESDPQFSHLATELMQSLDSHSEYIVRNQKQTGAIRLQSFYPHFSKPIIDEIDRALAQHYGFTAEELDFIINYDIKYRMGRDGGAGE